MNRLSVVVWFPLALAALIAESTTSNFAEAVEPTQIINLWTAAPPGPPPSPLQASFLELRPLTLLFVVTAGPRLSP